MPVPGSLIGLKVNGSFAACQIACSLNFKNNLLPSSAITSGGWKEFLYGVREWTMSVDGNLLLEVVPSDIKAIFTTGFMKQYPMYVEFSTGTNDGIQMSISGAALLDNGNISAPQTGATNWQANFQGTGELTPSYHDVDLLIDAMPSEADYPIIVDEQGL